MYACGFVWSALQPHPGLNLTHIVTDTLCERRAAGGARLRLVARAEAAVKNTVEDRSAILDLVEVPLGDLELGEGDNLLRREDRELDVLAAAGKKLGQRLRSQSYLSRWLVQCPRRCLAGDVGSTRLRPRCELHSERRRALPTTYELPQLPQRRPSIKRCSNFSTRAESSPPALLAATDQHQQQIVGASEASAPPALFPPTLNPWPSSFTLPSRASKPSREG